MARRKKKTSKYEIYAGLLVLLVFAIVSLVRYCRKEPAPELPQNPDFRIQFIDVGQADAALVFCEGETMLIDGGNTGDGDTIYSILKKHELTSLDYVVCTHAHEDHVGGLSSALTACTAETVLCPVKSYDSQVFRNFVKRAGEITVPKAGDSFELGGARVEILSCRPRAEETNDTSIVLKIIYGETSFLFTGDAEYETESLMLEEGCDLSATVLKVGHHGSSSSTSYRFLNAVMPQYAVISVGRDNSYGHPHDEVLSRLRDADVTVLRTDERGDIICESNGKTVTFSE